MLPRWLTSTHDRANDLRNTLAAFDGTSLVRKDGYATAVGSFQKLSKQLTMLQERQADPSAAATLERHFTVPSAVTGLAQPAIVPHLLSTRLDKEQEDQISRRERLSADTDAMDDAAMKKHNATLRGAQAHLTKSALLLDLPGAAALGGPGAAAAGAAGGSGSNATSTSRAGTDAAPASTAATQAVAMLLVGALRNGTGLECPPASAPDVDAAPDADEGGDEEGGARKRPRSS